MEKKLRPDYERLVDRIAAGEITRAQAAELAHQATGQSAQTFLGWIRNSGASKRLRSVRGNVGANNIHAHKDPVKVKAYEDALAMALSGQHSVRHAAANHGVSYQYLLHKVRKLREEEKDERFSTADDRTVEILKASVA